MYNSITIDENITLSLVFLQWNLKTFSTQADDRQVTSARSQ